MNSTQIQCFFAAAELLNFTDAAAALHISQPAFSRNIAQLENEWGISLFLRSNKQKSTQLTRAGKVMYDGLKTIGHQFDGVLTAAKRIHGGKSGELAVGLISSDRIDERALIIFDRFQTVHPDIELSLRRGTYAELVRWLQTHSIDMIFSLKLDIEDKAWIDSVPLYAEESVLLLSANHPLLGKKDLSLADFKEDTFISISPKESPALNKLLFQEFQKIGLTPNVIETGNISEQVLYLESGKGVAIASVNNTAGFNTQIKSVSLPELRPLELVAAWNREHKNPCLPAFIQVMSS